MQKAEQLLEHFRIIVLLCLPEHRFTLEAMPSMRQEQVILLMVHSIPSLLIKLQQLVLPMLVIMLCVSRGHQAMETVLS